MPRRTGIFRLFSGCRDSEKDGACAFTPSIFGKLLKPINRRQFDRLVARHDGDAYDKSFKSWDHLVALIYAQFTSAVSLRGLKRVGTPTASITIIWAAARCSARPCRMPTNAGRWRSSPRPSAWSPASSTGNAARRHGDGASDRIRRPSRSASCATGPNRTGASAA